MYPISAKKRKKEKKRIVYPNSFSFSFFEKVQIPKFTPKRDNVSKVLSKKKKKQQQQLFLKWKLRVLMSLIRVPSPIKIKHRQLTIGLSIKIKIYMVS